MENGPVNVTITEDGTSQGPNQTPLPVVDVLFLLITAILPAMLILLLLALSFLIILGVAEPHILLLPSLGPMNYVLFAVWLLIAVFVIPGTCIFIPPLSAFLLNLIKPVMASWLRAAFSSSIFLVIFIIPFLISVVLLEFTGFAQQVSVNLLNIIVMGLLLGMGMSVSLGMGGWLGAYLRTKKAR